MVKQARWIPCKILPSAGSSARLRTDHPLGGGWAVPEQSNGRGWLQPQTRKRSRLGQPLFGIGKDEGSAWVGSRPGDQVVRTQGQCGL